MTTIMVLPAPTPSPDGGGRGRSTGPGAGGGDFAARLDAEVGRQGVTVAQVVRAAAEELEAPDGERGGVVVDLTARLAARLAADGVPQDGPGAPGDAADGGADESGGAGAPVDVDAAAARAQLDADAAAAEAARNATREGADEAGVDQDGAVEDGPAGSGAATDAAAGAAPGAAGTPAPASGSAQDWTRSGAATPITVHSSGGAGGAGGGNALDGGSVGDGSAGTGFAGTPGTPGTSAPAAPAEGGAAQGAATQPPTTHVTATPSSAGDAVGAAGATTPGAATANAAPATPSAPAAPPVPANLTQQLSSQLGVRLGALRTAGASEHVLTLRVDPESFGPVRVVAHIGHEGVRVELLGATDAARDALRAALPDLRRDLAGAGLGNQLDLGTGDGRQTDAGDRARPDATRTPSATGGAATGDHRETTAPTRPALGGLDLLA